MVAIVYHRPLIRIYKQMDLVGNVFSLNRFAIEYNHGDVRNEGYMLTFTEFYILICRNTT